MSEPTQEKITVSYDDLNSRKVEQRLKEQDALVRNRIYAAMDETMVVNDDTGFGGVWRNSIFALAFFGMIGGLLAWGLGAMLDLKTDLRADSKERLAGIERLIKVTKQGQLEFDDSRRLIDNAIAVGSERNPYFALEVIRPDAEFRRDNLYRLTVLKQRKVEPAGETQKKIDTVTSEGRAKNPDFAIMTDTTLSDDAKIKKLSEAEATRHAQAEEVLRKESAKAFVGNILAYGVRGVILGLLLAIAIPITESNVPAIIINGSVGAALGLVGGVAAAFVTTKIQSLVTDPDPESYQQFLAMVATWGALGIFLSMAPGIVMRNRKKFVIGMTGGLIGGLIGGVLYEPLGQIPLFHRDYPRVPELVAMVAIGLLAGLATGLIEDAAKTGWLKVVQGLIAGKQFILYRNPTFIGAGPDCQIYLFKDPKVGRRHAAIHIVPGGFELEDLPLGTQTLVNGRAAARTRLRTGDRIQVGGTQLVFMEKNPS